MRSSIISSDIVMNSVDRGSEDPLFESLLTEANTKAHVLWILTTTKTAIPIDMALVIIPIQRSMNCTQKHAVGRNGACVLFIVVASLTENREVVGMLTMSLHNILMMIVSSYDGIN